MNDNIWKHLPYAIYSDTNVLRSAGTSLNKPWISELLSITNQYGITLYISLLVVQELCEHVFEILTTHRQKIISSIDLLKEFKIKAPNLEPQDINLPTKDYLVDIVSQKLKKAGFNIINNCDVPLSELLKEAINKYPPFQHGGKGFCDAIIIESYVKHAIENFPGTKVLMISNDSAVKNSGDRFKKHGITVEFVGESEVVEKLKSLLNDEVTTIIEEKKDSLYKYILTHETTIFEQINKTPIKITDAMLSGIYYPDEDNIDGNVIKILSFRPTKITHVSGGVPFYGEEESKGRYQIHINVDIELDVVVRKHDNLHIQTRAVLQPNLIDKEEPAIIERDFNYQYRENIETIKRGLIVIATIDAAKEKQNVYEDLKIEKII